MRALDGRNGSFSSSGDSNGNTTNYTNGIRSHSQTGPSTAMPGLAPPLSQSQLVFPPAFPHPSVQTANEPPGWPSEMPSAACGPESASKGTTGRQYMVAHPFTATPVCSTTSRNGSIVAGPQISPREVYPPHSLPSLQHQNQHQHSHPHSHPHPHLFPPLAQQTHRFRSWSGAGDGAVPNDNNENPAWMTDKEFATTTFRCNLCVKSFRRRSWLKRHLLSHSSFKPHGCPWCQSRHKRRDNLFQHMKTKHPREVLQELYKTGNCVNMSDIEQFMSSGPLFEDGATGITGPSIRTLVEQGRVRKDRVKIVLNELATRFNGEDTDE
ncbi:LAFA_0F08042g1_1 [Lachancea sp. 'fantastica']|nr:LAFA_0F08042g1_1 [Lachancea sp. 'fantastica']